MRVHIVCRDATSDQVLARLAGMLAAAPGFTVSERPDLAASVNYFFPYLEWDRHREFKATPTAAWFTHRDIGRKEKETLWAEAAQAVDLRLTSSPVYARELETVGATALVTPPLDRERFALADRPPHDRSVIGTSGYVYPGGRKGEKLLARLAREVEADVIACGEGWPVPTQHLDWGAVPGFYQSLDLYVCTSRIEGIGYGPLEAMACGVPVVVPEGVGVFDELPHFADVHRYAPGQYASLKAAVDAALARIIAGQVDHRALRESTWSYTAEAWIDTHLEAFEDLLDLPTAPLDVEPAIAAEGEWRQRAGIYIVAYGDPARNCAKRAIQSAKAFMPDLPVVLVSDRALGAGEDATFEHSDDDLGARSVKTEIYDLAPEAWEYVLYLDADTEVVADISFLFQVLADGWDAVFCINPAQYVLAREMSRPDNADEIRETFAQLGTDELLQLNGGVFGFRRGERTAAFFRAWHAEWKRYGKRDQAALDRVLYRAPLRVYVLGNEWNTITRYLPPERTAGILHYPMQARRWKGAVKGRLDSSEAWASVHPGGKA
ncbi:MAG TPA: glycosyltransferase [Aggregatilinea sp.]|uniref:glycosyltransferase n=1 Tax=Aggregatilinea sp. TaxID=2806333 RepID=UPI002CB1447C|nr:glycosyltransferase [Aggregatilinea sp.]HML23513.1 glycosyltransferase [Aggregatilinea sp.]